MENSIAVEYVCQSKFSLSINFILNCSLKLMNIFKPTEHLRNCECKFRHQNNAFSSFSLLFSKPNTWLSKVISAAKQTRSD